MHLHRFVTAIVIAGSLVLGVGVAAACTNSGNRGERQHQPPPTTTTTTAAPVVTAAV